MLLNNHLPEKYLFPFLKEFYEKSETPLNDSKFVGLFPSAIVAKPSPYHGYGLTFAPRPQKKYHPNS
ncbi:MAG: hypothetical protein C5B47_08045 [Verrucomicrobia bacterium]|nr:MAG: hypothetical protein C5B47_08045 [Verrucomicrobiota bacterium]